MKRADLGYFNAQWQNDPETLALLQKKVSGQVTRSQYKAAIACVKDKILKTMVREGRITGEELTRLTSLRTLSPKPIGKGRKARKNNRKSPSAKRKRRIPEAISKILPAHGRVHDLPTLWKYGSEVSGGLPGLGKKK